MERGHFKHTPTPLIKCSSFPLHYAEEQIHECKGHFYTLMHFHFVCESILGNKMSDFQFVFALHTVLNPAQPVEPHGGGMGCIIHCSKPGTASIEPHGGGMGWLLLAMVNSSNGPVPRKQLPKSCQCDTHFHLTVFGLPWGSKLPQLHCTWKSS